LALAAMPDDYGKCFILTADIDLWGHFLVRNGHPLTLLPTFNRIIKKEALWI
jgi:hypothetical protein